MPVGGLVMVHSSLASMGFVRGGAETVVDALLESLGPDGTLVVPTFSWQGEGIFDPRKTPSKMGAISEAARRRRSARRSIHLQHSIVVIGPLAEEIATSGGPSAFSADDPMGQPLPAQRLVPPTGRAVFASHHSHALVRGGRGSAVQETEADRRAHAPAGWDCRAARQHRRATGSRVRRQRFQLPGQDDRGPRTRKGWAKWATRSRDSSPRRTCWRLRDANTKAMRSCSS